MTVYHELSPYMGSISCLRISMLLIPSLISLTTHRIPLYFIPVSVSLRAARTLLKILLSENLHNLYMFLDIQEPKVVYNN